MIIEEEYDEDEESDGDIIDEEEVDYDEDEEINDENDVDYEDDMGIVFEKERYQTKLLKYLSKRIQRSSLIT